MRASRVVAVVSFAALAGLLSVTPSCADTTIVLATLPTNDAGAPITPTRCASNQGCPTGSFCSKAACSDTTGICEQQTVCDGQPELPVCGCEDSITYYNDCLRKAAGIAASTAGQCDDNTGITPCTGDGTLACPDPTTQVCALLIHITKGPCPPPFGTCWVIPASCPTTPDGTDRWNACDQADQTDHCLDTCDAIQSGKEFRPAAECTPPPIGG